VLSQRYRSSKSHSCSVARYADAGLPLALALMSVEIVPASAAS
jgi:hypothetical protein